MNKIILIGNLTKDPELRELPTGTMICHFGLAVRRDFGEDATDFFNVVVWQAQAKVCSEYLKKGNKVAIVGTLQNRTFEDRDGNKRTTTEIVAREVEFLSPKVESSDEELSVKSMKRDRPQLTEVTDNVLPF